MENNYSEYENKINKRHILWCPKCDNEILGEDTFVSDSSYRCSECGLVISFIELLRILESGGLFNEIYKKFWVNGKENN